MSNKRIAKHITNKSDIDEIISLSREEASSKDLIMRYFGDFGKGARFNPYDIIDIPANTYGQTKKNKNKFTTTIGLWIFNKSCIEPMADVLGYINEPITGDRYEELNQDISYARLENKISLKDMKDFIMQSQIIMGCCSAIAPSHTDLIFDMNDSIDKKKEELKKKYAKELANNDLSTVSKMEKELLAFTKDLLKDDPAVDMFNSGARSSWGNNVKNMYIMRGAIRQTDGSFSTVTTSYMDGMDPKDFAKANDAAVGGPYSRARKTASGGYLEKQFTNATQHLRVLGSGSDCGTKFTINISLNKNNIKDWMYSFFIENGKLVEITTDNKDKLIGKTVKMRFSSLCQYKKEIGCICEKCMGSLPNRIGITNVGLGSQICMSSLKNKQMSKFHNMNINLYKIIPEKIF